MFRKVYHQYHEFLYKNRLIDFDDMLVYTKELFEQRADILAAWQNKYRYILIDEFQDINRIQYDIIKMLAGERKNLFIVGMMTSRSTVSGARSRRSCYILKMIIRRRRRFF